MLQGQAHQGTKAKRNSYVKLEERRSWTRGVEDKDIWREAQDRTFCFKKPLGRSPLNTGSGGERRGATSGPCRIRKEKEDRETPIKKGVGFGNLTFSRV